MGVRGSRLLFEMGLIEVDKLRVLVFTTVMEQCYEVAYTDWLALSMPRARDLPRRHDLDFR